MAYRAGIVGASGYTGAELLRLLAGHPDLDVVHLTGATNAGVSVGALAALDIVFLALPHGESQRLVPALVDQVPHFVDLGADFRLPAGTYEEWYGSAHQAPELLDRFAFGLPELFRDDVLQSHNVAAPGCYPTAAALALAPLLAAGLVEPTGIVVNAVSGLS